MANADPGKEQVDAGADDALLHGAAAQQPTEPRSFDPDAEPANDQQGERQAIAEAQTRQDARDDIPATPLQPPAEDLSGNDAY